MMNFDAYKAARKVKYLELEAIKCEYVMQFTDLQVGDKFVANAIYHEMRGEKSQRFRHIVKGFNIDEKGDVYVKVKAPKGEFHKDISVDQVMEDDPDVEYWFNYKLGDPSAWSRRKKRQKMIVD
jgi:hypothetical protein